MSQYSYYILSIDNVKSRGHAFPHSQLGTTSGTLHTYLTHQKQTIALCSENKGKFIVVIVNGKNS